MEGNNSQIKVFTLSVFGQPVPEARARTQPIYKAGRPLIKNGRVIMATHTPKKTQDWRNLVRGEAQRIIRGTGFKMFEEGEALVMSGEFVFLRPKSVSVKKRPHHIVKPDLDNVEKNVKDALSMVVYPDDKQIIGHIWPFLKRYTKDGEQPFMRIWIYRYEDVKDRIAKDVGYSFKIGDRYYDSCGGEEPERIV